MALVPVNGIHHVALVVTDLPRAAAFYGDILGFQPVIDMGTRLICLSGGTVVALTLPAGPGTPPANDRFDENRVGLDHISFSVGSKAELENAIKVFDEKGVPHGEIKDLGDMMKLYVLAFRDPDNTQLELTAPY